MLMNYFAIFKIKLEFCGLLIQLGLRILTRLDRYAVKLLRSSYACICTYKLLRKIVQMAKHLAIVVDWYGPFTVQDALDAAKKDGFKAGLYVGTGKTPYARGDAKPQYIGLSKQLSTRLKNHHKLPSISRDAKIWLGEVATAEPSGKNAKSTAASLDYAEWLHAYFLQLPLNEKKTKSAPDRAVTVLNRWWKTDYNSPWVRKPRSLSIWPDLIDFINTAYPAKIVWFGKKQKRVNSPFQLG